MSSFPRRWAERAATDAALKLATGRFGTVGGGKRDAVWRARDDGVVELARAHSSRVELFEVNSIGASHLVASSSESGRKRLAGLLEAAGIACFAVGFPLAFLVSMSFMALGVIVWPVLAIVAALVKGKSDVGLWVNERFGTDEGWAPVPWRIHGTPTTGSQVIALSALTGDRNKTYYRVLPGGDLEVATHGRPGQLLILDAFGEITTSENRPKGVALSKLRGPDAAWYRVYRSDPDE